MRIAQVSPLTESVPPRHYGGTERVVSILTDHLVERGHDVTLFASGDSETRAELVPMCDEALRTSVTLFEAITQHMHLVERVAQRARDFDVVHWHTHVLHHPVTRRVGGRHVTTIHNRVDRPAYITFHREFRESPLVSISDAQRAAVPEANWMATIHHGLPPDEYLWSARPGEYLLFLGRLDPEKGVTDAVEIARASGVPLKLAGWIRPEYEKWAANVLEAAERDGVAEYVGEVDEMEKRRLLRGAMGLLFPIRWPEPFGLVMIEAMASGTPVIAFPEGSVPEVVDDGVTGFVVRDAQEGAAAVPALEGLDRQRVRLTFEERFSAGRMASAYEHLYGALARRHTPPPSGVPLAGLEAPGRRGSAAPW